VLVVGQINRRHGIALLDPAPFRPHLPVVVGETASHDRFACWAEPVAVVEVPVQRFHFDVVARNVGAIGDVVAKPSGSLRAIAHDLFSPMRLHCGTSANLTTSQKLLPAPLGYFSLFAAERSSQMNRSPSPGLRFV
jgi:hypothetical protein